MKGYVQIYTGDGKGKTTAALGLALRAAGAGLKVYISQFIKSGDYSEIKALARFAETITVEQFGRGRFIKGKPAPEDVAAEVAATGRNWVFLMLTLTLTGLLAAPADAAVAPLAAVLDVGLAEVVEQDLTPTAGGLAEAEQGVELVQLDALEAFLGL